MFRRLVMSAVTLAAIMALGTFVLPPTVRGAAVTSAAITSFDRHAFGDVIIDTPVSGSVQVYGGSAEIRDVIDGDLLVLGGDVRFIESGRVKGNLIYGGGRVMGAGDRVGGRIYSLTSLEGAAASLTKTAVVVSLLLVWLVTAVVLTVVSGPEIRLSSVEIRVSALHCFTLGLVAMTSFVLTAIVFSYLVPYVVGIPLVAALGVFAVLTKVYGLVSVFHALGTLVAGARTREQLAGRRWLRGDVAMVIVGVLVLGALRLIPVVGPIIWSLASIFGIGVALATKFGRREPWFLAWRPAEA